MESFKLSTGRLTFVGLITAVICILSPWAIILPFSPVPITLGLFAVFLSTCIIKAPLNLLCCFLYLLLGIVGLPVFSGFTGGLGILAGPTGGYLLGYLLIPLCTLPFNNLKNHSIRPVLPGLLIGLILCYSCGTLWLSIQSGLNIREAFLFGTLPYIPFDIIKLVLAYFSAKSIRKRLIRAGLFENM